MADNKVKQIDLSKYTVKNYFSKNDGKTSNTNSNKSILDYVEGPEADSYEFEGNLATYLEETEETKKIKSVTFNQEEIDKGISIDRYKEFVEYQKQHTNDCIKKAQKIADEKKPIMKNIKEIESYILDYKIQYDSYENQYNGEILNNTIVNFRNQEYFDGSKYGWTNADKNKSNEELLAIAKKHDKTYQEITNYYENLIKEELNNYELTKGLNYKGFLKLKKETTDDYSNALLLMREFRKHQKGVEYSTIKYLEDFKKNEKEYSKKIENGTEEEMLLNQIAENDSSYLKIYNYLKDHNMDTKGYLESIQDVLNQQIGYNKAMKRVEKLYGNGDSSEALDTIKAEKNNYIDNYEVNLSMDISNFKNADMDNSQFYEKYGWTEADKNKSLEELTKIAKENDKKYISAMSEFESQIRNNSNISNEQIKKDIVDIGSIVGYGLLDGVTDFNEGITVKLFGNNGDLTVQDYEAMVYLSELEKLGVSYSELYTVNQGVGNMLPVVAAGAALNVLAPEIAPFVTGGMIGMSSFGNTYTQMLHEGYDKNSAMKASVMSSASDAVLEVLLGGIECIGVNSALRTSADDTFLSFVKSYIKSAGQEGLEEVIQNTASSYLSAFTTGEVVDINELSKENLQTFIDSAIVSGILNGSTSAASVSINGLVYNFDSYEAQSIIEDCKEKNISIEKAMENWIEKQTESDTISNEGIKSIDKIEDEEIKPLDQRKEEFYDQTRRNLTKLEQRILSKITPDMSQLEIARLIYYELGRSVDYSEEALFSRNYDMGRYSEIYNKEVNFSDVEKDNSIVCASWAQLYSKMLVDAGFDENQIVIQRLVDPKKNNEIKDLSHVGVFVILDDGSIIMPDITVPLGEYTDIYNVNVNRDTEGFIIYTPEQIKQTAEYANNYDNSTYSDIDSIDDTDFKTLIYAIKQFESKNKYQIQNRDIDNNVKSNLTDDQQKFLETMGLFLFGNEEKKSDIRQKLEKKIFKGLREANQGLIDEADNKIDKIKKNISSFINDIGDDLQDEEFQEEYSNYFQDKLDNGEIDNTFLFFDKLNNTNTLNVRSYISDSLNNYGLSKSTSTNGNYIDMGMVVQNENGDSKTIRQQFLSDGGGIIPLTVYKDGVAVNEYYVMVNNNKVEVIESTPQYNSILAKLSNKKISIEERKILEAMSPNMTQEEMEKVPATLLSSGIINNKYKVDFSNDNMNVVLVENN